MRIAIHQPNYLPWCGYFYKMAQVDLFVILDDCSFTKSGVTHRVRIRTPQGISWLTVPVGKREIPILSLSSDPSQDWGMHHWNIIKNSYSKAAFWSEIAGWLKPLLTRRWQTLVDLNLQALKEIAGLLGIETPMVRTSEFPEGLKSTLGSGSVRNLQICQFLGAKTYVSGQQARDYNDAQAFASAGIGLEYVKFNHPIYPQIGEGFIPGLSIIDLLFNCGSKSWDVLFKFHGHGSMEELSDQASS
jgi:WbqC-like protein family